MDDHPPEPPSLAKHDVQAVVQWLDATAAWFREDRAAAAAHGHGADPEAERMLRLHEDAALLFREAYDGR